MPPEAKDTLAGEQRIIYDTMLGHYEQYRRDRVLPPPFRLQMDGGGGTGKSYLIQVISSHLQSAARAGGLGRETLQKSPVVRAAPTGVAGSQISGRTLHSLLRLPMSKNGYKPLSETPGVLDTLQRRFHDVFYLILDEKSMIGLRELGWVDRRFREIFPDRSDEYFGGLSVLLVGDFFQLPPVLSKPLYSTDTGLTADEIYGRNAYQSFTRSVFLKTIHRQAGDEQAAFRQALSELRLMKTSVSSWRLLASRCSATLPQEEVASFSDVIRLYSTKARVQDYNQEHMLGLRSPVIDVKAIHTGPGADKAESHVAGNLSGSFPICIGCRVMMTRNVWAGAALVNGAQGTVYDLSWASGADVLNDPPRVIMVTFDRYEGPPFVLPSGEILKDDEGRLVVPVERDLQEFLHNGKVCTREQFPLRISYAITVHKSQGVTLSKVVCDLADREFAAGLAYVAVSRASTIKGLMFASPFDRSRVFKDEPSAVMKMKIDDENHRKQNALTSPLYIPEP